MRPEGLSGRGQSETRQASQMTWHFRRLLILSTGSQELKINSWQDISIRHARLPSLSLHRMPSFLHKDQAWFGIQQAGWAQ